MIQCEYNESNETTVGVDFFSHYNELENGKIIKTQIWDTAGQERYRSLCSLYLRDAHVILLCIDTSIPWNNYNIEAWMSIIEVICIDTN